MMTTVGILETNPPSPIITNQIVGAGTGWFDHGIPSPDHNIHRRILIRVAENHTGRYCGKVIGEYLEKLVDIAHPTDRIVKMIAYIMGAFSAVEIISKSAPHRPTDSMTKYSFCAQSMA